MGDHDEVETSESKERRRAHRDYEQRVDEATQTAFWLSVGVVIATGVLLGLSMALHNAYKANPTGTLTAAGIVLGFVALVMAIRAYLIHRAKNIYAKELMTS